MAGGNRGGGGAPGLALGALGIVFGDIGTNVLFALRAAFAPPHALPVAPAEILGVLSLVFWALVLVIGVKYLGIIMRVDNAGEGGILALLALLRGGGGTAREPPGGGGAPRAGRRRALLVTIGLFGAALVYGDGVITPAISVLAAVEGLAVEHAALRRWVMPVTVGILLGLFAFQHRGTGRIGAVFGPVMTLWFLSIGAIGVLGILRHPAVLGALDPGHGLRLLVDHGTTGFLVLGAIVLAVAGAEALYADLGHFGIGPIRIAWFSLVFPALLLNYFGQGAVLLEAPAAIANPFYTLVPAVVHYPMVGLATAATVIASQALISGAFSLTRQAVQLGYLPPVAVRHTSAVIPGQIYIPEVNLALAVGCIALVLAFRESSRLAAAYGMAVAGAMTSTSILFYAVVRARRGWGRLRAGLLAASFLLVDLSFLGANVVKILYGAWIPLVIAAGAFFVMSNWAAGRRRLAAVLEPIPVEAFLRELEDDPPPRVPGTGIFIGARPGGVPPVVRLFRERIWALPERIVLLHVLPREVPAVPPEERVATTPLGPGIVEVTARFGFMEFPDVPGLLERARALPRDAEAERATYFIGMIDPIVGGEPGMVRWRKALFAFLWRNSHPPRAQLGIPPSRTVEIGMKVEL